MLKNTLLSDRTCTALSVAVVAMTWLRSCVTTKSSTGPESVRLLLRCALVRRRLPWWLTIGVLSDDLWCRIRLVIIVAWHILNSRSLLRNGVALSKS
ncbi:hypothetical protein MRB53_036891 [Persea americana]|nr:hypothetical protein MRB53_036891 [Persea americana]